MLKQNLLIRCLTRLYLFFTLTIGVIHFSNAQDSFSYKDYFPKQKVDSVEWYYGAITKEAAEKIDMTQSTRRNLESYFRNDDFPFDNPVPLLGNYFEKRAVLSQQVEIQKLVQVFPTDSCQTYSITRCPAIYRDILVFYKNGIPISVLKICFSCKATCFVSSNGEQDKNAKCLANPLSIKEIAKEWVRRGWIDLRSASR